MSEPENTVTSYIWLIPLIGALSGAFIGAVAGGYATYLFNKKHARELEKKQRASLAMALSTELKAFLKLYMDVCGEKIEKANKTTPSSPPLLGILKLSQNDFSIFDNLSDQISLLDKDIAHNVLELYINLKAFLGELNHYGKLTNQQYKTDVLINCADNKAVANSSAKSSEKISYFKHIEKRHFEVTNMIKKTISRLDGLY